MMITTEKAKQKPITRKGEEKKEEIKMRCAKKIFLHSKKCNEKKRKKLQENSR